MMLGVEPRKYPFILSIEMWIRSFKRYLFFYYFVVWAAIICSVIIILCDNYYVVKCKHNDFSLRISHG